MPQAINSLLTLQNSLSFAFIRGCIFTTIVPQPGMWIRDDVPIELVDTPPVTAEHVPTGLMGTIHNADVSRRHSSQAQTVPN